MVMAYGVWMVSLGPLTGSRTGGLGCLVLLVCTGNGMRRRMVWVYGRVDFSLGPLGDWWGRWFRLSTDGAPITFDLE